MTLFKKDINKAYMKYEINERLYRHMIFHMEKVMPSFEYDPLILSLEPKISNEEET
jgi:hypothetical protein